MLLAQRSPSPNRSDATLLTLKLWHYPTSVTYILPPSSFIPLDLLPPTSSSYLTLKLVQFHLYNLPSPPTKTINNSIVLPSFLLPIRSTGTTTPSPETRATNPTLFPLPPRPCAWPALHSFSSPPRGFASSSEQDHHSATLRVCAQLLWNARAYHFESSLSSSSS